MAEEPDNLVLHHLRELRTDMTKRFDTIDQRFDGVDQRLDKVEQTVAGLNKSVENLNVSVATLTVSNRHVRADVSQLLAESGDLESRVARIEKHLGLTDA